MPAAVYEFLLFVHVLSAFFLLVMVVMYSAFAFGGPAPKVGVTLAQVLDGIGGVGTLIFGVWLALYVDGYSIVDGWIIAALVLWAAAAETGRRTHAGMFGVEGGPDGVAVLDRDAIRWHVIRTGLIVLLLADMIFKPGA
jgi:hypothetical protein